MTSQRPRRWWPLVKLLLTVLILAAVGVQFARDLSREQLWQRTIRPGWLVPATVLYLLALSLSGLFWHRLLGWLASPLGLYAAMRAVHVSQLGKYIPGKAMALAVRVGMARAAGVPVLRATGAAFYEVLTTMACGALLASALFLLAGPAGGAGPGQWWEALWRFEWPEQPTFDRVTLALLSLGLFALMCGPLLPPVVAMVNRVVARVRGGATAGGTPAPQQAAGGAPAPQAARYSWLLTGLVMTAPGWLMLGVALACALQAIPGAEPDWAPATLARLTAIMGLSYVAGFVLPVPGGLGVREYLLALVLAPDLIAREGIDADTASSLVALAVLLLRLAWTLGELALAAVLYLVPPRAEGAVCPS